MRRRVEGAKGVVMKKKQAKIQDVMVLGVFSEDPKTKVKVLSRGKKTAGVEKVFMIPMFDQILPAASYRVSTRVDRLDSITKKIKCGDDLHYSRKVCGKKLVSFAERSWK